MDDFDKALIDRLHNNYEKYHDACDNALKLIDQPTYDKEHYRYEGVRRQLHLLYFYSHAAITFGKTAEGEQVRQLAHQTQKIEQERDIWNRYWVSADVVRAWAEKYVKHVDRLTTMLIQDIQDASGD